MELVVGGPLLLALAVGKNKRSLNWRERPRLIFMRAAMRVQGEGGLLCALVSGLGGNPLQSPHSSHLSLHARSQRTSAAA